MADRLPLPQYGLWRLKRPSQTELSKIDSKVYLHLYRGTSLEWLKKDDGPYLNHTRQMSFTTNARISEEFASINHSDGFTPIVMEIFVPISEVDFNYSILPKLSTRFSYGSDVGQSEYSTMWQVPISWMKGYWDFKNSAYNANADFDPEFTPKKIPLTALALLQGSYERYMPEELEELKRSYPDVEKMMEEEFEKYFQLQQKVNNWRHREKDSNDEVNNHAK